MTDYGGPGDNLTTIHVAGKSVTVNKYAAGRFTAFLNALIAEGYTPKVIGGYRADAGPTLSGANVSNHQLGLAIDIDPSRNPFVRGGTAAYALPPNVGQLAAQYGLYWGGNYKSGKDYMHFEVADAPYTPKNAVNPAFGYETTTPSNATGGSNQTSSAVDQLNAAKVNVASDWITALDQAMTPDLGWNPLKDTGETLKFVAVRGGFILLGLTVVGAGLLLMFGRDIFGGMVAASPAGQLATDTVTPKRAATLEGAAA